MPYTLTFHLDGTLAITLQKDNGDKKIKSVDVADIYQEGNTVTGSGGKKGVLLTHKGMFKATLEMNRVAREEQLVSDPERLMKKMHNAQLRDNCGKIVEEVKDKGALSKLLTVMSLEQVISEEQLITISKNPSVKECVANLVFVLEHAEPDKFLVFVNILQKEGYGRIAKRLDPRPKYPENLKTVSNLNDFGVVDHFSDTKKVSEVKSSLQNTKIVIIHGICGAGKTQLMFKVASDHERDYASVHPGGVVWVIDGTSRGTIANGVDSLRQSLTGGAENGKTRLQSLVDQRSHILLLIDDLPAENVKHIPKELLNCSAKMLITTQNPALQHKFTESKNVLMDGFTEDEAVRFLAVDLPSDTPRDLEHIKELAQSFSCLPLGLAAARGTIHECNMTLGEYKERLHGGKDDVDTLMDMGDEWLQDYYKEGYADAGRNIFAALQMAVNTLDDQCKYMLQLCAFLMPQNIPMLMLKGEHRASDLRFVRDLKRRSLGYIEGEGVKRRLFIHGVTQMALRLQMDREQQTATCINKLLQILVKFFSKDTMYSEMYKFSVALMPHVMAVLEHADKREQGLEYYPLMKARLLMVYGHLLIQQGTPASSEEPLKEARKLIEEFAEIPSDRISVVSDVQIVSSEKLMFQELYKRLAGKSQSLEDSFFEETVISRVITKQHLRVLSGKLNANDRKTLENMVKNVEPLTTEMYTKLADRNLAVPMETLKKTFLPELYMSINFVRESPIAAEMFLYFLTKSGHGIRAYTYTYLQVCESPYRWQLFSAVLNEEMPSHVMLNLESIERLCTILLSIKLRVKFYDFGLLRSSGADIFAKLSLYENLVKCYELMAKCAEEEKKSYLTAEGCWECGKMLRLVESECKAGNPPLRRAACYIVAGQFKMAVGGLEEAAEMFRVAYRVELKREEYHPRLREALEGLIDVHIAQNELGRARVCARRLLELTLDYWPDKATTAKEKLGKVCCKIVFRSQKQKAEVTSAVYEKVTTV
ncbi:uncharacterized protein [Branchiostoma lanceolatum]|uniref:uncharacterized protein n=1 Tax=Branchiostoma lanceolatum TaxID=7740 RepID=UPI0034534703